MSISYKWQSSWRAVARALDAVWAVCLSIGTIMYLPLAIMALVEDPPTALIDPVWALLCPPARVYICAKQSMQR